MEAPYGRPAAFPPPNQAREYENQAFPHMTDGQMDRSFQIATKLKNTNPIIKYENKGKQTVGLPLDAGETFEMKEWPECQRPRPITNKDNGTAPMSPPKQLFYPSEGIKMHINHQEEDDEEEM